MSNTVHAAALRQSEAIPAALGQTLCNAFTAVRAAEAETYSGQGPRRHHRPPMRC